MKQPGDDSRLAMHTNLCGLNPLDRAYKPQCDAVKVHCTSAAELHRRRNVGEEETTEIGRHDRTFRGRKRSRFVRAPGHGALELQSFCKGTINERPSGRAVPGGLRGWS